MHYQATYRRATKRITRKHFNTFLKGQVQRNGTHNYYICIEDPTHRDPITQGWTPIPIADRRVV